MQIENYSKNGYLILRNAISKKLIKNIQKTVLLSLNKKNNNNSYNNFKKYAEKLNINNNHDLSKLIRSLNKNLFDKNLINLILCEKKILKHLNILLGSDLAVSSGSSLTINLADTKKNYYHKDWHQEIWSGASTSHIQFWLPIFHKSKNDGQIDLIKYSHGWGHIPHSGRKPIKLPKKYSVISSNLDIGDVLLFSTTMIHRTSIAKNSRLGLAMTVKNFKYKDNSFSNNFDWTIFSYSEITKIEKVLGNHFLSPYRLNDQNFSTEIV